MTNALLRRFRKARYRIKGLRVFAVGHVKEGANLKRFIQIEKSKESDPMPDAIQSALVLSESAKSAASSLMAASIQSCAEIKDSIDSASVGASDAVFPTELAEKMMGCADQIVNGVKALAGLEDVPESERQEPVEAAQPTADQMAEKEYSVAEKLLAEALEIAKKGIPAGSAEKVAKSLEKAKVGPKMNYKAFLSLQSNHMLRLFDLLLEIAPFMMALADTPEVQAAIHQEHEATEAASGQEESAPSSRVPAAPSEGEAVGNEGLEMAKKPVADKPVEMAPASSEEKMATIIAKALGPVGELVQMLKVQNESTTAQLTALTATLTKSIGDVNGVVTRLQKSHPASLAQIQDPPEQRVSGTSRNLSAEVRQDRATAKSIGR